MNPKNFPACKFFAVALLLPFVWANAARAELTRTQTISLHRGWNAVHLQVTPLSNAPAAIFAGTPVTIAATFFGGDSSVQFIQNPGSISWKHDGWSVWYAPSRPDGFLASLYAVQGNRGYLVYAESDYTWNVTGTVTLPTMKWKPDSFNYVGLGVNAASPPTFGRFFAGSAAHTSGKIYRLVNNQWVRVANAATEQMRAGEACWIYCAGASDYQGPLTVKLTTGDTALFGSDAEAPVTLANATSDPLTVRVETVAADGGLPLGYVVRGISTNSLATVTFDLPANYTPPTLEAKQTSYLWLKLRRERMAVAAQSALLKISTDSGAETWLPVSGSLTPQ
ncbi:MAG: hypothetical protein RL380_1009 [Verrucomicrobiota bacterium]|jgi:hypothetical protein